jgi:hypothetical protein
MLGYRAEARWFGAKIRWGFVSCPLSWSGPTLPPQGITSFRRAASSPVWGGSSARWQAA